MCIYVYKATVNLAHMFIYSWVLKIYLPPISCFYLNYY